MRRAAPEPNRRALYVGGLDPRVTEEVLRQIFETVGNVQSVKIIPDKNVSVSHQPSLYCDCLRFLFRCYSISLLSSIKTAQKNKSFILEKKRKKSHVETTRRLAKLIRRRFLTKSFD